jgi:hypothetical protein
MREASVLVNRQQSLRRREQACIYHRRSVDGHENHHEYGFSHHNRVLLGRSLVTSNVQLITTFYANNRSVKLTRRYMNHQLVSLASPSRVGLLFNTFFDQRLVARSMPLGSQRGATALDKKSVCIPRLRCQGSTYDRKEDRRLDHMQWKSLVQIHSVRIAAYVHVKSKNKAE